MDLARHPDRRPMAGLGSGGDAPPGQPCVETRHVERGQLVGGHEAEHGAEERQTRLEHAPQGGLTAEAMTLAFEGEVGVRDPVGREGRGDRLGVGRHHDPVLEPLEDEDGRADPVEGVDR